MVADSARTAHCEKGVWLTVFVVDQPAVGLFGEQLWSQASDLS